MKRQASVEGKKIDPNTPEALPSSSDEEEDIDRMRDDLASTKNQLTQEIQRSKKLERDQKIYQIDIESYQAEIKVLKRKLKEAGVNEPKPLNNPEPEKIAPQLSKSMSRLKMGEEEGIDFEEIETIETEITALQDQIYAHRQRAEAAERKIEEWVKKLDVANSDIEEWETKCNYFQKKYKQLQGDQPIAMPEVDCRGTQTCIEDIVDDFDEEAAAQPRKSASRRSFSQFNRMESFKEEEEDEENEEDEDEKDDEEEEEEEEETETETESEEEIEEEEDEEEEPSEEVDGEDYDEAARELREQEKRNKKLKRDIELWKNKIKRLKDKESTVKEDRKELREKITNYHNDMLSERQQYLKVKAEVNELLNMLKDPNDDDDDDEEEEEEVNNGYNDDDEGGWWLNDEDEKPLKPKKLKKKKRKKYFNADGRLVEEENDEDLENLTALAAPVWYESEDEESETDNEENEDYQERLVKLQLRAQNHELCMGGIKKSNYLLKEQAKRCDEMYNVEHRRHMRLNEELQKLLIDVS